jgi:ribonuclease P protein component
LTTHAAVRKTFPKRERLHQQKLIKTLFDQGKSYNFFPIKLIYLPSPEITNHQALFTVPRRNFKKAVDRNRIKRQMREAYRLHKHQIPYSPSKDVHFLQAYIYIARKQAPYQDIESKIKDSIGRLIKVKL